VSFRIFIPKGRSIVALSAEYRTLAEARRAFEIDHGEARWCLIGPREQGQDESAFLLHGSILRGNEVAWTDHLKQQRAPVTQAHPRPPNRDA
jgi:hypothetical protein